MAALITKMGNPAAWQPKVERKAREFTCRSSNAGPNNGSAVRQVKQRTSFMELDHGRLRATLIAGKIELIEEAFSTLIAGLNGIACGYRIERVVNSELKTDAELRKELSRLYKALRTALSILDSDMSGLGQIEVVLSGAWDGRAFRVIACT